MNFQSIIILKTCSHNTCNVVKILKCLTFYQLLLLILAFLGFLHAPYVLMIQRLLLFIFSFNKLSIDYLSSLNVAIDLGLSSAFCCGQFYVLMITLYNIS